MPGNAARLSKEQPQEIKVATWLKFLMSGCQKECISDVMAALAHSRSARQDFKQWVELSRNSAVRSLLGRTFQDVPRQCWLDCRHRILQHTSSVVWKACDSSVYRQSLFVGMFLVSSFVVWQNMPILMPAPATVHVTVPSLSLVTGQMTLPNDK